MKTVLLANTGIEVSAFCLGAMRFGWATDEETSYRLLDQYVEAGGTFPDTANIYGRRGDVGVGAISETLLGQWMRTQKPCAFVVATKLGFPYLGVECGLRAAQIEEECEKSLVRSR